MNILLLNKVKNYQILKTAVWVLVILKTRCCIKVVFGTERGILLQILNYKVNQKCFSFWLCSLPFTPSLLNFFKRPIAFSWLHHCLPFYSFFFLVFPPLPVVRLLFCASVLGTFVPHDLQLLWASPQFQLPQAPHLSQF